LFLVGTALQLVDTFNLYVSPPDTPAANMVDQTPRSPGLSRRDLPVFFLNNFAFGVAFVAIAGLGFASLSSIERGDLRRVAVVLGLGVGGILGAVGQLILLGATRVTIDYRVLRLRLQGDRDREPDLAQMLANGASEALVDAASLLAAVGVIAVGSGMPVTDARGLGDRVVGDRDSSSPRHISCASSVWEAKTSERSCLSPSQASSFPIWSIWLAWSFRSEPRLEEPSAAA
jgi:hypothetical protein